VAPSEQVVIMPDKQQHRALRRFIWVGRVTGWSLIALAVVNLLQIQLVRGFGLLSSLALGVLGIAWVVGLELFLHFFDRYLSRN
jgi:hypothetical protein